MSWLSVLRPIMSLAAALLPCAHYIAQHDSCMKKTGENAWVLSFSAISGGVLSSICHLIATSHALGVALSIHDVCVVIRRMALQPIDGLGTVVL